MKKCLRRIGGAVGVGLIWGAAWAAVGALIRMLVGPNGFRDELWVGPAIGLHPGFVGGVVFSAVLGVPSRTR